ncbi:MAG: DUF4250 domain-containing protein [Butyrivibrio sp.]|nr:DUF4250 domain-containing protein [Butyrivibrio sp.]
MLPEDPMMLLSYVNTMLRDEYSSLDELCDRLDVDKVELTDKLSNIGYKYSKDLNAFK